MPPKGKPPLAPDRTGRGQHEQQQTQTDLAHRLPFPKCTLPGVPRDITEWYASRQWE